MNYKNKKNIRTLKNKKRNNSRTRKNQKRIEIPNVSLLKKLCSIHSPSGQEEKTMDFLVNYVKTHKHSWAVQPKVIHNDDLKNNLILVFGKNPKNVIMMHMDSIGYIYAGENSKLYRIGGVEHINKAKLRGFTQEDKEIHTEVKPNRRRRRLTPITIKTCVNCNSGTYENGDNICKKCPSGKWQANEKSTECNGNTECPTGKFGIEAATSNIGCTSCPNGKYSNAFGQNICK